MGVRQDLYFLQKARIIPDERVENTWKVSTLSYEYNIERRADGQEIVCFHWEGLSAQNSSPHIHIGHGSGQQGGLLSPKKHIPSGRVLIEDVVFFLIEELKVKPIDTQQGGWKKTLKNMRSKVMQYKTW